MEERTYYTLPTDPAHDDIETEDAARHVADLLGESVRLQLQADVPVGVSLSGGTDSSAIASLATLSRSGADNLTAITISWPDTAPHEVAHSRESVRSWASARRSSSPRSARWRTSCRSGVDQ